MAARVSIKMLQRAVSPILEKYSSKGTAHLEWATDNPICLAQRARIAEGMRKAGLSEG
jgi:hypothetical protein